MNNSGAVSPEMRATASSTPVIMPRRAARTQTSSTTFQCAAPRAAAASRIDSGTSRSMSSLVRTTIGITRIDKATTPAQPEKWWNGATSSR